MSSIGSRAAEGGVERRKTQQKMILNERDVVSLINK